MAIEVTHLAKARGGFERLPNEAIRNVDLSIAAVGLLARLLADGHTFNSIDALADFYGGGDGERKRGTGRDAYRAAAKELDAVGHLNRVRIVVNGLPAWRLQVFAEPYMTTDALSVPMTARPLPLPPAERSQTPSSRPTTAEPLSSPPAETVQHPSSLPTTAKPLSVSPAETTRSSRSRPTTAKPSSFLTDFSTDRQTSSPTTAPFPLLPPDWIAAASEEGVEVQEEGEEFLPQHDDENTTQAAAFVDALPFDRNPTTAERADLTYLAGLWFKAGWSHDALMAKCEAGLEDLRDRTRAWIKFRLAADKVCKPPPSAAHQTYKDPTRPVYYDPKKSHQAHRNPTDPDAYEGSF